ncbi:hypothetical protein NSER024013_40880 [Nocardia seriolae]|nr:hypothetical protein NSER024013_40880 [Nocardia seriolae]
MHASRFHALLQEPGLVTGQHRLGVTQALDHVVTHTVTHRFHVPIRSAQQPLHPLRTRLTSTFGQRPPVLALQPRQQSRHVLPDPLARLRPREPTPDPTHQRIQLGHNTIQHHTTDLPAPTHIGVVAVLSLAEQPLPFTEDYFPTKLITDLFHSSTPHIAGLLVHPGGTTASPTLNLLGGSGLVTASGIMPVGETVTARGYHNLDVLTAAAQQNDGRPEPISTALAEFATR